MGHDSRARGERPPSEAGASGGGIRPSSPMSEYLLMEEGWGKHPGLAHDLATSLHHHRTDSAGSSEKVCGGWKDLLLFPQRASLLVIDHNKTE